MGRLDTLARTFRRRRELAAGIRRVEVGSGGSPQPGYLHVDRDPHARHLEYVAEADELPLADGWADEVLAYHMLEHVEPWRLDATLREWRRVLRPGGSVEIHTPDSAHLMARWLEASGAEKWALQAAILGMGGHARVRAPEQIPARADHQLLFDREQLRESLVRAGFIDIRDVTEEADDMHTVAWRSIVPQLSIVVGARRAE